MGDYLRSLGVNLLQRPYFEEGTPVCDEVEYEWERHGSSFQYSGNMSFQSMSKAMDEEIRQMYTQKPLFVIIINWVMLALSFSWTIYGFFLWLVILACTAQPKQIAGALMARRAFEMEKATRMSDAVPEDRQVDIGAHHIILQYMEHYIKILFYGSPFKSSPEFSKLRDVQQFAEDACSPTLQAYGWPDDEDLKSAVVEKAVITLSDPQWGFRSLLVAVPASILMVLMTLNVFAAWFYSVGYFMLMVILFAVIAIVQFYMLFDYVMVTRILRGITGPAEQRMKDGHEADAVQTVTDLGVCAANKSINIPDSGGVIGSEQYWGRDSGTAAGKDGEVGGPPGLNTQDPSAEDNMHADDKRDLNVPSAAGGAAAAGGFAAAHAASRSSDSGAGVATDFGAGAAADSAPAIHDDAALTEGMFSAPGADGSDSKPTGGATNGVHNTNLIDSDPTKSSPQALKSSASETSPAASGEAPALNTSTGTNSVNDSAPQTSGPPRPLSPREIAPPIGTAVAATSATSASTTTGTAEGKATDRGYSPGAIDGGPTIRNAEVFLSATSSAKGRARSLSPMSRGNKAPTGTATRTATGEAANGGDSIDAIADSGSTIRNAGRFLSATPTPNASSSRTGA